MSGFCFLFVCFCLFVCLFCWFFMRGEGGVEEWT